MEGDFVRRRSIHSEDIAGWAGQDLWAGEFEKIFLQCNCIPNEQVTGSRVHLPLRASASVRKAAKFQMFLTFKDLCKCSDLCLITDLCIMHYY